MGRCYRVSRAHPRGKRTQWQTAPFLYPPRDLLLAYRSGAMDFSTLSREYRQALDGSYHRLAQFQEWTQELTSPGDVTLLCFERGEKPCHRRVAAQWLLDRVPELISGELR